MRDNQIGAYQEPAKNTLFNPADLLSVKAIDLLVFRSDGSCVRRDCAIFNTFSGD